MKKITLFFACMLVCLLGSEMTAQTFSGAGGPIPASGSGGFGCAGGPTLSDANSTLMGTIGTEYIIDNVTIDLTHTWDSDMEITLVAPDGTTTLDLSSGNGGSGDNYTNTVFQDGGADITAASAPFTGTFEPEGGTFAATFDGVDVNGNWQLQICDNVGGDPGTLLSYEITFIAPPPYELDTVASFTLPLDENGEATLIAGDLLNNATVTPVGNGTTSTAGSTGIGLGIVDNTTVETTINVADSGIIGEDVLINNIAIDISHTWDGDINLTLVSPEGTSLDLTSGNGGSGDNYTGTVFQDGNPNISSGSAPFTGMWEPEGGTFLATFDGEEINGDWIVQVEDTATGDPGTLNDFVITFEEADLITSIPDGMLGETTDITLSQSDFTCADVGDVDVTITSNDGTGDILTEMVTVTIVDDMGPAAMGPIDIFTGSGAGDCSTIVTYDPVTATDNCGSSVTIVQTAGLGSGASFPVGTTTEEYTITDPGGNVTVYSFNVTITDTAAPTLDCPSDFAVSPDDAGNYTIEDYAAGASDNCSAAGDLVITQEPAAGTVVTDGSVTDVVITVTDEAGNVTECGFALTVDATLGLNDASLDAALSLYPNPTNGTITLRNGSSTPLTTVVISDINGRIVSTTDLTSMTSERQLSLDNLAAGVYFAKISSENASVVKRIIRK